MGFPPQLWRCHATVFWASFFSDKTLSVNFIVSPLYIKNQFFLINLKKFSLSLAFNILTVICVFAAVFGFIFLGVYRASCMCWSIYFSSFWEILSQYFFKYFSAHFSPSGIPTMHMLVYLRMSHIYLNPCSFFPLVFLSVRIS